MPAPDGSYETRRGPGAPNDHFVRFVLAIAALGILVGNMTLGALGLILDRPAVTAFASRSLEAGWRVLLVVYAGYYAAALVRRG